MEAPIYLGESLRYFVNNIEVNIKQGTIKINLIDHLPLLKAGYTTYDSLYSILDIAHWLYPTKYEEVRQQAFNGNIPAHYYSRELGNVITMEEAVNEGLIEKPLNSYQLIGENGPFITYNSVDNYSDTETIEKLLEDEGFLDEIEYETSIIEAISIIFECKEIEIEGDIELSLFWKLIKANNLTDDLVKILSTNDYFKLYIAIISGNWTNVQKYLLTIDPRFDDNQAYVLAMQNNVSVRIIKAIKDKIIKDNWYEKHVYLANAENAGYDIYSQIRK